MNSFYHRWHKKIIGAVVLGLVLAVSISSMGAAGTLMKWLKLDTMDTNFSIIENKAGDQEVLLKLDLEDSGTYDLYYYLEENRQTHIQFVQSYDQVDIIYTINEGNSAASTNITQDEVDLSYLEMNYDLTVPDWEFDGSKLVGASGGLEYSITRSASTQYPGVAFDVNNKRVIIKWDFLQEEAYVLIDDYENGKIMPVQFDTPNKGSEDMKVLKQLEDFIVTPTHLKPNAGNTANIDLAPVVLPNSVGDVPGNRPGLEIKFKQPKEFNTTTWAYEYTPTDLDDIAAIFQLDNIGADAYLDFSFNLQNDGNLDIANLPAADAAVNAGVEYLYDGASYEYTLYIVQDKSDLVGQGNIIQWSELQASSIYNAGIGFQVDLASNAFDDYEFTDYAPEDKLAYTYMEYELKRANAEEAYLDIEPYNAGDSTEIEYTILYSKTIKATLDPDEDLWLKSYHTMVDEDDEIYIPVPFRSTSSQDAYQVIVKFSGTDIYSQVLNYEAINDDNVPPTTPAIDLIDNLFVVPPQDTSEENPVKVMFDLVWEAPSNKVVKELDAIFDDADADPSNNALYYEISINDVPLDTTDNPYDVIKVFEVYEDAGEYKLKAHDNSPKLINPPNDSDSSVPSEVINYDVGYNETDELFRMEKIVLYDEELYTDGWATVLETVADDAADTYTVTDSLATYDFEFPGVNYIRVKAISISDGELSTSQMSIPTSLALSLLTYDIPIVDTLTYEPLYGTEAARDSGTTLKWQTIESQNYENNMLSPIDLQLDDVTYSVYMAENADAILPLDEDDSNYNLIAMDSDSLVTIDDSEIDLLRNGEVLYFDLTVGTDINTELEVDIKGLDINRNYNVRIVTKFNVDDNVNELPTDLLVEVRRSEPSSVLAVTVPKIPGEPGDEEIFPLSPEFLEVAFADENQITTAVSWIIPAEMTFAENENGFEIVAIEDRSLPEDLNGKSTTVEQILESTVLEDDVVEGWRIYMIGNTTYIIKYNRDTDTWNSLDISHLEMTNDAFRFIDDANGPNRVNYYYVRTVKMEGTEVKATSPWAADSITTAPVKGPINLIVDYESAFTFDPKTEFILRFDAPVPDIPSIGTDYIIEIYVKGEDDTDYTISKYPVTFLGGGTGGALGYERVYYRLTGLSAGKTYDIKVRIEDRSQPVEVLPDGSTAYPKSPFSDKVTSRTEFDQESYDKENQLLKFLDYYYTRTEALKELLYFEIQDSTEERALKYRENYSEGVIKRLSNSEWVLENSDKAINTYYIPSESLEAVNDSGVTIVIENKDQIVGIRPDTLGVRLTSEIDDLLEDIAKYASTYEDYYLRIRVFTDDYNGKVAGETPTSVLMQTEFGLVGSRETEEPLDDRMVASLDNVIEANKSELLDRLEAELENGINENKLLDVVEDMVEKVRSEYMVNASIIFQGEINSQATIIKTIDKPIYLQMEPEVSPANNAVYTKSNGIWKKVASSYFSNRYYVETTSLDPFVLIPSILTNQDLIEIYSQRGVDVINTYNLSTIFSSYELDRPEEVIDKYQWISALARLAGAEAGSDTADWLKDRGIEISIVNSFAPMTYEEALDAYVQTYAYRHVIDLARVYISNYNLVDDMADVSDAYVYTIVRGANLGIIDTDSGPIKPQHQLTMADAIELLITLHHGLD